MDKDFEKSYHQHEKTHFWFRARRQYIINYICEFSRDIKILDIGCSSGILLKELETYGFDEKNLYGIDISEDAIIKCRENGLNNVFVMDAQNIHLETKFDLIVSSDCLEHLKDDEQALKNWYNLLTKEGIILIFVPAFQFLWSEHDSLNMHYRRYNKKILKEKVINQGFSISKESYWNFFLFFPVALFRFLCRFFSFKKQESNNTFEQTKSFNNFLYALINFENNILKYINFPFGISVFCIAKK